MVVCGHLMNWSFLTISAFVTLSTTLDTVRKEKVYRATVCHLTNLTDDEQIWTGFNQFHCKFVEGGPCEDNKHGYWANC
jgi:hypothetical protein